VEADADEEGPVGLERAVRARLGDPAQRGQRAVRELPRRELVVGDIRDAAVEVAARALAVGVPVLILEAAARRAQARRVLVVEGVRDLLLRQVVEKLAAS
jgi:hypothetical protein